LKISVWYDRPDFPPATLRNLLLKQLEVYELNTADRRSMELLGSRFQAYDKWRKESNGIVDLFWQHASLFIDFTLLMSKMAPLRPWYYSIASASREDSAEIDLLLNVVEYSSPDGTPRRGLCSNFLDACRPGVDVMPAFVQSVSNKFRLPSDPKTPIVLIGIGSGLAPFRGFYQERSIQKANGVQLGACYLFFGCRNEEAESLRNVYCIIVYTSQVSHLRTLINKYTLKS